mmetsp:Transcript_20778/g.52320  ORF Transcript_20778/g.52320 Transcript_20778/m.52320 type:complete len:540 (+) Transcript_20778:68-1687(+)
MAASSSGSAYPRGFSEAALSKIAHGHEEVLQLLDAYKAANSDALAQKEAIEALAAYVLSPSKIARVLDLALLEGIYEIFLGHRAGNADNKGRPSLDLPLFSDLETAIETRQKELILLRRYYSPSPPAGVGPGRSSGGKGAGHQHVHGGSSSSTGGRGVAVGSGGKSELYAQLEAGTFDDEIQGAASPRSPFGIGASPGPGLQVRSPAPRGAHRNGPSKGLFPGAGGGIARGRTQSPAGNGGGRQGSLPAELMNISPLRKPEMPTWGKEHAAIKVNNPNNKQWAPVYYVPLRTGANNFVKNPRNPKQLNPMPFRAGGANIGNYLHAAPGGTISGTSLVAPGAPSGQHQLQLRHSQSTPHFGGSTSKNKGESFRMGGALQVSQMSSDSVKVAEQYPVMSSKDEAARNGGNKNAVDLKINRHSQPGKYTLLYREEELHKRNNAAKVSSIPENADANKYSVGTLAAHFNEDTTRWLVRQQAFQTRIPPAAGGGSGGGVAAEHLGGGDVFQDTVDLMLAASAEQNALVERMVPVKEGDEAAAAA